MVREIDTCHLGRDRVIAAHLVRGVIIDPGPESALDNWVDALPDEPRAVLLTHVHLDHAGATGALVRRFPHLRVYVSEVGAPHVADPARLLASATRLYGAGNMQRLWGEVLPVPAERLVSLAEDQEVEGFRVAHTPGHASHHVVYLDLESGDAYVGDMAGVRIPPAELTVPPTPPPEIDVEAWLASLEVIAGLRPRRLHLTHFGEAEPDAQLALVAEALRRNAELARDRDRVAFLREFEARIEGEVDQGTATRLRQACPPDQQWAGLERYWLKRVA